jgi:hypothetical protein
MVEENPKWQPVMCVQHDATPQRSFMLPKKKAFSTLWSMNSMSY